MQYPLTLIVLTASLLSACASSPATAPSSSKVAQVATTSSALSNPSSLDRCTSSAVNALLNRPGSTELLEQARQQAGAQRARLIAEDDVMTMDYDSQRLNLYLDQQQRIKLITCG